MHVYGDIISELCQLYKTCRAISQYFNHKTIKPKFAGKCFFNEFVSL